MKKKPSSPNPKMETGLQVNGVKRFHIFLSWAVQTTSNCINEGLLCTWDCDTTHWMIKSKLFFSLTQQVLEWRVLLQVWDWNHEPLLLGFYHINSQIAFWHISGLCTLLSSKYPRQTKTHDFYEFRQVIVRKMVLLYLLEQENFGCRMMPYP